MSAYAVLFPADDEATWVAASEEERQATYDTDAEFRRVLEARGGRLTGGAGLAPSSTARTLRRSPGADVGSDPVVTDGPYAEAVEQLSGFFLVTCDDPDALVEAARVLVRAHPVVEIRPLED